MANEVPRRAMWAGLRSQLVKFTSIFFTSVDDYLRFRAVCKSWRSAVPHRPDHLPTQLPFLLLVSTSEPRIGAAFRLTAASAGNVLPLPNRANRLCIGTSFGWLILLCMKDRLINLFNPVTAENIRLPYLDVLSFADVVSDGDGPVIVAEKAVLSSDPTLDRDFVAVLFTRGVTIRWYTWRHGDESWTANANFLVQITVRMRDVVPYDNRTLCAIYGENDYWAVLKVDPGPPGRATIAACYAMPYCVPRTYYPSYLVVAAGKLLLAASHYDNWTASGNIIPEFRVFRLEPGDISRPAVAVEVDDIHDRILFLSPSSSMSVSAEDFFGFQGNFIYFVNKDERDELENWRVWQIVVQDLETDETNMVADSKSPNQRRLMWRAHQSDVAQWVPPNLRSCNR
ncbi:uncharacterized protein LOC103998580 [Musa acuminata AAA Group]|uniref:uncharacterized protein LOC103998580 n=1 Tax=Musa acuminata AAA Group TaxID=214697 RepID=UPI0031D9B881